MNVVDVLDGNKQSGLCFLAIILVIENILNIANILIFYMKLWRTLSIRSILVSLRAWAIQMDVYNLGNANKGLCKLSPNSLHIKK